MKHTVYVLKSEKFNKTYVGYTNRDINDRLKEHNENNKVSSSRYKPYSLVYYEFFECSKCAIRREKFLKSGYGRNIVKLIVGNDPFNLLK